MKRWIYILAFVALLGIFILPVCGAEFHIDENTRLPGMTFSWYQGYEPVIRDNTMTIYLPIRGETCVDDIEVSIAPDEPNVYLLADQPKTVKVDSKDGIYPAKLTLYLERNRRNGDYPMTIAIRGADGTGKELVEEIPYVIRIRDGAEPHEVMKPVISDVAGDLDVGTNGSISMTITNPTTTQSIINGELTIRDPMGEIIMLGSNRVQLNEILPNGAETVNIPVSVVGNASVSLHTLEVSFRYTVLGESAQWIESFTLPVTQGIRLEQGGVQIPPTIAGELGNMTLPLMNMGKGELQNVLVKLEVDGVLDAQSVLVGTMTAGETKQAKLTFVPKLTSVGTYSGTVTITCEDAYGNAFSQLLDVSLTVDEPIPEEEILQEKEENSTPKSSVILMILCGVLLLAFILQRVILTNKIHKMEEERL